MFYFFAQLLCYIPNFSLQSYWKYACKPPHKLRYFQICRISNELLTDIVKSKIVPLNNSSYILMSLTLWTTVEIDLSSHIVKEFVFIAFCLLPFNYPAAEQQCRLWTAARRFCTHSVSSAAAGDSGVTKWMQISSFHAFQKGDLLVYTWMCRQETVLYFQGFL